MKAEQIEAVADAGPIIHLHEINQLHLLRIFSILHIPNAIWEEITDQNRVAPIDIKNLKNIHRHTFDRADIGEFIERHNLKSLHSGELESLFLCHAFGVPLLLTDDLAVRQVSKELGITPIGSLGVVVRAFRLGIVSLEEAEQHLIALHHSSSLFVTSAIIDLAVEQLRTFIK
jgi:predicted nucleic acid-binding protein